MAFTTPKTWSVGETLTAANFNAHIRDNQVASMHVLARKSSDEIVNNSAALQDDNHLLFAVAASETWFVQAWLMWDSGTTPDIKFHWTLPAGATMKWAPIATDDGVNFSSWGTSLNFGAGAMLTEASTPAYSGEGVGTIKGQAFTGIAVIGGTAGSVTLQWAQNTANATDTTVRQNSCLVGMRLA